jgi:transposase
MIASDKPIKNKPVRKPLPEHLAREVVTHTPVEGCCPDCSGALCKLGEDVSEYLERIPETFKVVRHVRIKMSCPGCDKIVQPAAAPRLIERCLAGPALLAHVLAAKYANHIPLNRQSEMYARGDSPSRHVCEQDTRRRYAGSSAIARARPDQDRAPVDVCSP